MWELRAKQNDEWLCHWQSTALRCVHISHFAVLTSNAGDTKNLTPTRIASINFSSCLVAWVFGRSFLCLSNGIIINVIFTHHSTLTIHLRTKCTESICLWRCPTDAQNTNEWHTSTQYFGSVFFLFWVFLLSIKNRVSLSQPHSFDCHTGWQFTWWPLFISVVYFVWIFIEGITCVLLKMLTLLFEYNNWSLLLRRLFFFAYVRLLRNSCTKIHCCYGGGARMRMGRTNEKNKKNI